MTQSVTVKLNTAGAGTGPLFDIINTATSAVIAADVDKGDLLLGYDISIDPDVVTQVTVKSKGPFCTNEIILNVSCTIPFAP